MIAKSSLKYFTCWSNFRFLSEDVNIWCQYHLLVSKVKKKLSLATFYLLDQRILVMIGICYVIKSGWTIASFSPPRTHKGGLVLTCGHEMLRTLRVRYGWWVDCAGIVSELLAGSANAGIQKLFPISDSANQLGENHFPPAECIVKCAKAVQRKVERFSGLLIVAACDIHLGRRSML